MLPIVTSFSMLFGAEAACETADFTDTTCLRNNLSFAKLVLNFDRNSIFMQHQSGLKKGKYSCMTTYYNEL
ncbi:hypothetical protein V1477_004451 [Vespula maculifrons]|uniref:Uncharacterized protein n=1 Tax=Vespula maculifrons TaxID=7453 RepID=A0ABD2CRM2_VESMC